MQILSEQADRIRQKIAALSRSLSDLEALKKEVLEMKSVDFKRQADIIVNLEMKNDFYGMGLILLTASSLAAATLIGLAVRNPANISMISILIFLPSILLSGIMFPTDLLPAEFAALGKLFPAAWEYARMKESVWALSNFWPLLAIFITVGLADGVLLNRIKTR